MGDWCHEHQPLGVALGLSPIDKIYHAVQVNIATAQLLQTCDSNVVVMQGSADNVQRPP